VAENRLWRRRRPDRWRTRRSRLPCTKTSRKPFIISLLCCFFKDIPPGWNISIRSFTWQFRFKGIFHNRRPEHLPSPAWRERDICVRPVFAGGHKLGEGLVARGSRPHLSRPSPARQSRSSPAQSHTGAGSLPHRWERGAIAQGVLEVQMPVTGIHSEI
jgi:hypothetical protein